jgi:hypothetical protein
MIENHIPAEDNLVKKIMDSLGVIIEKKFEHIIANSVAISVKGIINSIPYIDDIDDISSAPNFISGVPPNIYFRVICSRYAEDFGPSSIFQLMINFGVGHYLSGKSYVLPHNHYFRLISKKYISVCGRHLILPSCSLLWSSSSLEFCGGDEFNNHKINWFCSEFKKITTHGGAMIFINEFIHDIKKDGETKAEACKQEEESEFWAVEKKKIWWLWDSQRDGRNA